MQAGFFEKQIVLTPDLCGSAAALSPLAAFTIFQGIASEHAERIGVGGAAMAKRGEFWLTVHSRVDFYEPAYLMDELTARTWPEQCEGRDIRCFRSYRLTKGEQTVALGRTQWAILGPEQKILRFEQSGFPADFPFPETAAIAEPPVRFHDELTQDVGYEKRAAFVEKLFLRSHIPVHTVLDLACGTGTMTALLTERGYELIGVDGSEDMLLEAREKAQTLTGVPPLFLHQSMPELDLYGTVEAAICCLDSLNYLIDAREVRETFRRLHLFIAPGGSLVFDVHALGKLEAMDGQVWLDEREDVYCVWRTEYSRRSRLLDYYVDIFSVRADGAWERSFEEHRQRWYSVSELTEWLTAAGFGEIRVYGDCRLRAPNETDGRIYISCIRKE